MAIDQTVKEQDFEQLQQYYHDAFVKYGDSSAGILLPKGRHELRFSALDDLLKIPGRSILDYGCGFAYLKDYIKLKGFETLYSGVDLSQEFIETCRKKHPDCDFNVISPDGHLDASYDIIFSSGIFNIATNPDPNISKKYAFDLQEKLFANCNVALVSDFLTDRVDFFAENAQHFGPEELATYCSERLSRRFVIRHDILPYELTMVAFKNAQILSPQNIFQPI